MNHDRLVLIAKVFRDLGNPGSRAWDVAEYLSRHDSEAHYSGPLKKWWYDQVMVALSERSQPAGDFWFIRRGGEVYEVKGTIPEGAPESPPLGPGEVGVPCLLRVP